MRPYAPQDSSFHRSRSTSSCWWEFQHWGKRNGSRRRSPWSDHPGAARAEEREELRSALRDAFTERQQAANDLRNQEHKATGYFVRAQVGPAADLWIDKLSNALWSEYEDARYDERDENYWLHAQEEYEALEYYERTGNMMHHDECTCHECEDEMWRYALSSSYRAA